MLYIDNIDIKHMLDMLSINAGKASTMEKPMNQISSPPLISGKNALAMLDTVHQLGQHHLPAGSPDAELIRLCAEYEAAEQRIKDLYEPDDVDEDQAEIVLRGINAEVALILDRMEVIRAQTPAGIHARARAMTACNPDFAHSFDYQDAWPWRLLSLLMRDAMALEVAA
jgi:hypothetical protein